MSSERIKETSNDDWQRSLLRAAASEVAPDAATAQVLRALQGLPQALGGGAAGAAAPALGGRLASFGNGGALKLATLLVAALGAGFALYWFGLRERRSEPAAPSVVAAAAEQRTAEQQEPAPVAPFPDEQPLAHTDNPASVPVSAASRTNKSREQRSASSGDALSRELRLLSVVRARVREHDAATARQLLAEYRRAFPHGVLEPEAAELERRARELGGAAH